MVSVIIPVFNRKPLVEEMIQCIISQTYHDWELLLVDDGSVDGTLEMMFDYSKTDNRIQVIKRHLPPKGGQTCRNIGLEKATGEYIIFFDSDDLISQTCLQKRVEFMDLNNDIDFGIFPAKSFYIDKLPTTLSLQDLTWGIKTKKDILLLFLSRNYPFIIVTNIYRKKSILKNNLIWDEKLTIFQDFDFNINTILKGLKYKFASNELVDFDYFYRMFYSIDTTCSQPFTRNKFKSTIYLLNKTIENLKYYGELRKYHNALFGFVKDYFKHLILANDRVFIKEYFSFCNTHYSKFKVLKLKIIAYCSSDIKNPKLFNFIFISLLCLFFPKTEFLQKISIKLRILLS